MLVYDRKREFEVNIAKVGMQTMADMMAAAQKGQNGDSESLSRALSRGLTAITDGSSDGTGPGKADAMAYDALDSEIQRTGYMGMKAYRWAKRVSDWEVSVCLDRGPGVEEVQW